MEDLLERNTGLESSSYRNFQSLENSTLSVSNLLVYKPDSLKIEKLSLLFILQFALQVYAHQNCPNKLNPALARCGKDKTPVDAYQTCTL
jgi:hypothetical protein